MASIIQFNSRRGDRLGLADALRGSLATEGTALPPDDIDRVEALRLRALSFEETGRKFFRTAASMRRLADALEGRDPTETASWLGG